MISGQTVYEYHPHVAGTAAGALYFWAGAPVPAAAPTLFFVAMLPTTATLVGYATMFHALLRGMEGKPFVAQLKAMGRWTRILRSPVWAMYWAILFGAVSLACLVLEASPSLHPLDAVAFAVWLGVGVGTMLAMVRVLLLVRLLVTLDTE